MHRIAPPPFDHPHPPPSSSLSLHHREPTPGHIILLPPGLGLGFFFFSLPILALEATVPRLSPDLCPERSIQLPTPNRRSRKKPREFRSAFDAVPRGTQQSSNLEEGRYRDSRREFRGAEVVQDDALGACLRTSPVQPTRRLVLDAPAAIRRCAPQARPSRRRPAATAAAAAAEAKGDQHHAEEADAIPRHVSGDDPCAVSV